MVRRLHRGMVVFLDTRAEEHLVLPFPVKAVLLVSPVFPVQLEHQLQVVPLLFLGLALKEVLHLPAGLLVLRHLPADLRKATRVIHLSPATDPRQLRLSPPLPQALVPYPLIPLSYPVHLRWNKSRCSAR